MSSDRSDPVFARPEWHRATRLTERAASLRERASGAGPLDLELAMRELAHWKAEPPFDRGTSFARRLAMDEIDERELLEILGEPIESVRARTRVTPRWLDRLERAYRSEPRPLREVHALPAALADDPHLAFLDALEPLVAQGVAELDERVASILAAHPAAPFDRRASALFIPALLANLERLSARTFALELRIARMQGALVGDTPRERFASFVRGLSTSRATLELLASHPVLARRIVESIERWRDASAEFLERLALDGARIAQVLARGVPLGRLTGVRTGAGDAHKGGRSVVVATFEGGTRVVYKPRSLAVDVHFQELVHFLNRKGQEPELARLAVLDRGAWGWVEFVEPRACRTIDEARAFYRRQGCWLALLHALAATDLHFENVIAAGEHPMLVDLETLFHARAPTVHVAEHAARLARDAAIDSVLRVGLLPSRVKGSGEGAPDLDVGGLSRAHGQLTPDAMLAWEGEGTDEMQAVRERAPLPAASNLPVVDGRDVIAAEHAEEIVRAFESTYRLIGREREALLAPDGAIARFAEDEVRSVLRPSRFYGLLIEESSHPDFQGDALELDRLHDRLWLGADELAHLERALASERADLEAGDVPLFTSRPGARALFDSRGRELASFWNESGLELVARRVRAFGETDLARQMALIRGSIAAASATPDDPRWPAYFVKLPERAPDEVALRSRALAAARAIGDRLETQALRDDGGAAWMGFVFQDSRWELMALPDDLYAGAPGVALFLAHLARATGEERHAELARAAVADLVAHLDARVERMRSIGAFNGLGGLVYVFAHLARSLGDARMLDAARHAARSAARKIGEDEDLDVVGGAAGLCLAMESLVAIDPRAEWDAIRGACGAHLVARAERTGDGAAWRTRIGGAEPVTGFSHGAAGIACALARLARDNGDASMLELARAGARFENAHFDAASQNWLDPGSRRVGSEPSASSDGPMVAWCYGAPGIALARIATVEASAELDACADGAAAGDARRDLEIAARTTRDAGFGRNHSLCHGALGNLDCLSQAARALGDRELADSATRIAASVLASLEAAGPLCGMPTGIESAALMNGLAGIGLGLLRIARPDDVPSVLALAPPNDA